jgi:c-di-GMP phosphodiesterase
VRTTTQSLVTRQPIYDDQGEVFGFELRAQPGPDEVAGPHDRFAARAVVDGVLSGLLDVLAGGSRLVFSVSGELLLSQLIEVVPAGSTAVKLPPGTPASSSIAAILSGLRRRGGLVILSGLQPDDERLALLDHADIAGVDLGGGRHGGALLRRGQVGGLPLLAEGIDSAEALAVARDLGCHWYQGAVFVGSAIAERSAPPGFKPVHLALLQAVSQPELDFADLERVTRQDVQLTHEILRYVNSAAFAWRRRIESLEQAFVLLGERQVRSWATLVVMADLATDQPQQLAVTAGVRARFCERLGAQAGVDAQPLELFTLGMFSLIDLLMGQPMSEALADLPLASSVKEALLGESNELRPVLDAVIAHEQGDWDELGRALDVLGTGDDQLLEHYLAAIDFAATAFDRRDREDREDRG